jgi:hypothetical protein
VICDLPQGDAEEEDKDSFYPKNDPLPVHNGMTK